MSNLEDRDTQRDGGDRDAHLADLPDGAGCFEIWDHLSARRGSAASD